MKTCTGSRALVCASMVVALGCSSADPETGPTTTTTTTTPPELIWACEAQLRCADAFCDKVLIPEGEFSMGSDQAPPTDSHWPAGDERPIHRVQLDNYCINKYEVSLGQYEACVDDGICSPAGLQYVSDIETVVNHYSPACVSSQLHDCLDHAVNAKNYWQARDYCAWQGQRLCTEAEWERAANGPGPQRRLHPWGDDPPTTELVNIPSVGSGFIDPVASHPTGASAEGVFNMEGNVFEWVRDGYALYQPAPDGEALLNPLNLPESEGSLVIARGSCFFTEPTRPVTERTTFTKDFDWG